MTEVEKVVIIGSGPAGLTAAIYASRASLNPLVISGMQPGGQLTTTSIIENYPGFIDGVDGNELMQNMRSQAERVGSRFKESFVKSLSKLPNNNFKIELETESIEAKTIIIATGAAALTLGLPSESKLMGYGISTCATCDGFFYRKKKIAVVGGGDSALEEALYLSNLADEVNLIVRRDKFRASPIMQERAQNNPKIKIFWNTQITDTLADAKGLTGLILQKNDGSKQELMVDGLFMAIGHRPNTDFLKGFVEMDSEGYVTTYTGTATNVPGVFAAGDVEDKKYRQAITSAGRGCQAALQAQSYLEGLEH